VVAFSYITHLIFGVVTAVFIAHNPEQLILCMVGSILPDIDTRYSLLGKFNPLAWFGLMRHRGFTHTIAGCILMSILAIPVHAYLAMLAGCLSHIIADKICSSIHGRAWHIKLY
jgi:membrane-bound metal-dependent hydrolase YbcI (DUF457 family)